MDAGVPIGTGVAGIAMGLVKEGDRFSVLSDLGTWNGQSPLQHTEAA
jgi:polyribonucleotide nucleotidyltransferase